MNASERRINHRREINRVRATGGRRTYGQAQQSVANIERRFEQASRQLEGLERIVNDEEIFGAEDSDFVEKLITWADIIRKTFYDDGVDEVISTRRLCHIAQTFSIFKNRAKAIDLCIARFDDDTKSAFLDLYSKVDAGVETLDTTEDENGETA